MIFFRLWTGLCEVVCFRMSVDNLSADDWVRTFVLFVDWVEASWTGLVAGSSWVLPGLWIQAKIFVGVLTN